MSEVLAGSDGPELRRMYAEWGSFRTTIDLVEMVLAKSEVRSRRGAKATKLRMRIYKTRTVRLQTSRT